MADKYLMNASYYIVKVFSTIDWNGSVYYMLVLQPHDNNRFIFKLKPVI